MQNLGSLTRDQTLLPAVEAWSHPPSGKSFSKQFWLGLHIFGDIWGWETKGGYWERSKNTTMLKDPLLYLKVKGLKTDAPGNFTHFHGCFFLGPKNTPTTFLCYTFFFTNPRESWKRGQERKDVLSATQILKSVLGDMLPSSVFLVGMMYLSRQWICLNDNSEAQ